MEFLSGRRYGGKLAQFGERVLAKIPTAGNGDARFVQSVWLGKTDYADFHLVMSTGGLKWTRAIRRLPDQFDAPALQLVRTFPWGMAFGQIGTKVAPLGAKPPRGVPVTTPVPPHLQQAGVAAASTPLPPVEFGGGAAGVRSGDEGAQEEGESLSSSPGTVDEAASDPPTTPRSFSYAPTTPRGSNAGDDIADIVDEVMREERPPGTKREVTDETTLQELLDMERSAKAARTEARKAARTGDARPSTDPAPPPAEDVPPSSSGEPRVAEAEASVRAIMLDGEELEDGDELTAEDPPEEVSSLSDELGAWADRPPELTWEDLAAVDREAAAIELKRLIEIGVLIPKVEGGEDGEFLTTKMVFDWRKRGDPATWTRRARLVGRDFAWLDPFRTDTFSPTTPTSLNRLVPAMVAINRGWIMKSLDVKDAYLMCSQDKNVEIEIAKEYADQIGIPRRHMLGKVLPGQREGAAKWHSELGGTLRQAGLESCPVAPTVWVNKEKTVVLVSHVDDLLLGGEPSAVEKVIEVLKSKYSVKIEGPEEVSFLKRKLTMDDKGIQIEGCKKYLESLQNLLGVFGRSRVTGSMEVDDTPLPQQEASTFRSAVGILLYMSADRADIQFMTKSLAQKLKNPTRGAMSSLRKLVKYLNYTQEYHTFFPMTTKGESFMRRLPWGDEKALEDGRRLIEVAVDSDWSGDKKARSSTSACVIWLNGLMLYSFSRTQKSISLSSSESEYTALVGGAAEAMYVKAVVEWISGPALLLVFSDNSAARALACREGVGKIRHLHGKLLWLQQKIKQDVLAVQKIGTLLNPSDIGTKSLSQNRVKMLAGFLGMRDGHEELGREELLEQWRKEEAKKHVKRVRRLILEEMEGDSSPTATTPAGRGPVGQLAKRLMRVTMLALLTDPTQALGQAMDMEVEETITKPTWTTILITVVIGLLMIVFMVLTSAQPFWLRTFGTLLVELIEEKMKLACKAVAKLRRPMDEEAWMRHEINILTERVRVLERYGRRTRRAVRRQGVRITGRRPLYAHPGLDENAMTPTSSEAGSDDFKLDLDPVRHRLLDADFLAGNIQNAMDLEMAAESYRDPDEVTKDIWAVWLDSGLLTTAELAHKLESLYHEYCMRVKNPQWHRVLQSRVINRMSAWRMKIFDHRVETTQQTVVERNSIEQAMRYFHNASIGDTPIRWEFTREHISYFSYMLDFADYGVIHWQEVLGVGDEVDTVQYKAIRRCRILLTAIHRGGMCPDLKRSPLDLRLPGRPTVDEIMIQQRSIEKLIDERNAR